MVTLSVKCEKCISVEQVGKLTQAKLFGEEAERKQSRDEWKGMPEFEQDKQECFSKIIVRFEKEEDLNAFSKLIGQKLTKKTKSIWHPAKSHWNSEIWRWVDEP